METSFDLILTSAGKSTRFNEKRSSHIKKECASIDGKSVLSLALNPFLSSGGLKNIVITYPEGGKEDIEKALLDSVIPSEVNLYLVEGGKTRTASVRNGVLFLKKIKSSSTLTAVHDGARPFLKSKLMEEILSRAEKDGAAAPALKLTDAVKTVDGDRVVSSLDRSSLVRVQTPQIFTREKLISVYEHLAEDDVFQDDIEPYVNAGNRCSIVPGDEENIKITYSKDLERKEMRIGFGNDIHVLVEGRDFMLGGVKLPFSLGEKAHSDGDVLIHALIDAVLGAYALGDIGCFFPPEDNEWKDMKSSILLKMILDRVQPEIINVDSVITLEGFKLKPYTEEIRESLASLLNLPPDKISVKAKTNEGLDALGESRAVKAEVVILTR